MVDVADADVPSGVAAAEGGATPPEVPEVPSGVRTCSQRECTDAAAAGDVTRLKRAHENGCPWNERTCEDARRYLGYFRSCRAAFTVGDARRHVGVGDVDHRVASKRDGHLAGGWRRSKCVFITDLFSILHRWSCHIIHIKRVCNLIVRVNCNA